MFLERLKGPNYIAIGVLVLVAVSFGLVAVQTFASGSVERYRITADTYVTALQPNRGHAGLPFLRVDNEHKRYTYLQVNVPNENRTITKATLRLHSNNASRIGYDVYSTTNEWTARALRFDNRPEFGAKLGSSGSFGNSDWTAVDVTSYVKAAGTYSFGLATTADRLIGFDSSETRRGPVLVVEYATSPSPTASPRPTATATSLPTVTSTATPQPSVTTTPRPTTTATPRPTATATPVTGANSMYLSPSSANAAAGSNVTFQIRENSGTTAVNAVQANISFDAAKFQYVSTDDTGADFGLSAITQPGSGIVKITRAVNGGSPALTGDKLVTKVTFKALGTGNLSFATGSAVSSTAGVDTLKTTSGATVTVSGSSTPAPTVAPTATPTTAPTPTAKPSPTPTPAPGTGTIYYAPPTATAQAGATVTFQIRETSGSTAVNAVQANVTYDATKLEYQSTNDAGADFGLSAVTTPASGLVKITRGVAGGSPAVSGDKLVTSVNFKVLGTSGTTPIGFGTGTALVSVAGIDILKTTTGATLTMGSAPDSQVPTAPTALKATAPNSNSVSLSWTAATDNVGVVKYHVLRGGLVIATVNAPTVTFTDATVLPATPYTYTVTALDAANLESAQSAPASITTPQAPVIDSTPPSTPTNVTAKAVLSTQVNVAWTASTDNVGVSGYHIYRNNALLANTNASSVSYGDGSVQAGHTYTYEVSAFDANSNESPKSPVVSVTTPAAATPTPTATPTVAPTATTAPTTAPGVGSIYLSPASAGVATGATVTFQIRENSGTTQVNAVQANLTYDATKLQYVSVDDAATDFGLVAITTPGTGTLNLTRAVPGGSPAVTGDKLVTKVTFKVIGTGTVNTPVGFAAGSAVVSLAGSDTLKQSVGATVKINQITP